jgi:hypothetical protein
MNNNHQNIAPRTRNNNRNPDLDEPIPQPPWFHINNPALTEQERDNYYNNLMNNPTHHSRVQRTNTISTTNTMVATTTTTIRTQSDVEMSE